MPVASVIFLSATGVFSVLLHALVISNPAIKMDANRRMYEFLILTVQSIFNPNIPDYGFYVESVPHPNFVLVDKT